jgi:hypothetical protein
MYPALVAVILIAIVVAFLAFNPVTPVSARQILERASVAQSADKPTQGIWHTRLEEYQNPQALTGDSAGTKTIKDTYADLATGHYRTVTRDVNGKILDIFSDDGAFTYSSTEVVNGALTVVRIPKAQDDRKRMPVGSTDTNMTAVFDQFNNNPRVQLTGEITWADGSLAYVLVNENHQVQKQADGQSSETLTGATRMIFNAQTYRLLESETSVRRNGRDIVINSYRFGVNEILAADSKIAWDLSDLKGIVLVDGPQAGQDDGSAVEVKIVSAHELTAVTAYVLKTIPAGFTQKIIIHNGYTQDDLPFGFEINYSNSAGESFGMQATGLMQAGFVETNFYDGSYKAASGLVLNYGMAQHGTSAILTAPDGYSFLLFSSLPREQVQAWVEDLVPAK